MLKRRMWKVATCHFLASIVVCFTFFKYAVHTDNFFDVGDSRLETPSTEAWLNAWYNFSGVVALLFQPIQWWAIKLGRFNLTFSCLFTIPIWSICFGWIFVKLDNWLNHFPVLGRKVF